MSNDDAEQAKGEGHGAKKAPIHTKIIQFAQRNGFAKKVFDIDDNRRTMTEALKYWGNFKKLLRITSPTELDDAFEKPASLEDPSPKQRLILEFLVATVLAAKWYDNTLNRSWWYRGFYGVLSIALIAILPIGMYFGQVWVESWKTPGAAAGWTAGITAMLTSFAGLQKAFGTWLDNHKRFGQQWRARAGLRDLLYTLRDKWLGQAGVIDPEKKMFVFSQEFITALDEATHTARTIIRTEQQDFFQTYSFPTADILSTVTSARTEATSFISPLVKPVDDTGAMLRKLAALQANISNISKQMNDPLDPDKKASLTKQLNALNTELETQRIAAAKSGIVLPT